MRFGWKSDPGRISNEAKFPRFSWQGLLRPFGMSVRLDRYTQGTYTPGAPFLRQVLWYCFGSPLVQSGLPSSKLKVWVLRAFGAQVGVGVCVKPGVKVKFPWRLRVGDYVWLGERAWFDNLAVIELESHVCVSQNAYLCTGSHDWGRANFGLRTFPIRLGSGSWVGANACVGPGVTIGERAVLTLGSVATSDLEADGIYTGNPAERVKTRVIRED